MSVNQAGEIERLTAWVLKKKKYREIFPGLIRDIANQEINKGRKRKETQKAILGKLHQIGAAYFAQAPDYAVWKTTLASLPEDLLAVETREACITFMQHHHSTNERQYILETFFQETLASIQPISSILDLACGLNPLALPWMPVKQDVRYYGTDIFSDMIAFLNLFTQRFGIQATFQTGNIFDQIFTEPAKVAFLLKTLPCLEQVRKGFSLPILQKIPAEYILISYPISSLSGKNKGMQATYSEQFHDLIAETGWPFEAFTFSSEVAFLVEKR